MKKDESKGYIAVLGWSLKAIEALEQFDRRYLVVAPPWAEEYALANDIPYMPWHFERLNEKSYEIAKTLSELGIDSVQPRLPAGMAVALGLGAVAGGTVTLTMSFDSAVLAETEAGRVLARIRQLIEEPYGLLA